MAMDLNMAPHMASSLNVAITGFAEIILKSFTDFKLLVRDKNAVKTKVASTIRLSSTSCKQYCFKWYS